MPEQNSHSVPTASKEVPETEKVSPITNRQSAGEDNHLLKADKAKGSAGEEEKDITV